MANVGNGTNEDQIEAKQVKIDENTYLTDVIKISVGTNHVLALTKNGQVYSWGDNRYGQLGHNNKENSNYAKLVLGEGGSGTLNRIVDISAGNYGSSAVNEFGWLFVWGNGSFGEMGNGTNKESLTPAENATGAVIQVSMGAGNVGIITQSSSVYTWGRNNYGQLGIGSTTNSNITMRASTAGAQISCAGYETIVANLKEHNSYYVAGLNNYQQLGSGGNINKLTKVTLTSSTLGTSKMKYVKAGTTTTNILLSDGRVFTSGSNLKGELGGGEESTFKGMLQGKAKDGELEPIISIGRSSAESTTQNTVVIGESGRAYTAGDNTYSQIGDHSKENKNYFTVMGYKAVEYEPIIRLQVGETKQFTSDDLAYVEKYFNIYKEDKFVKSLVDKAKILDGNIATYENGLLTANRIGSTMLIVKDEETQTLLYIPVEVLPENAEVLPDSQAGENFTVGLRYNGTVWTFGTNTKGELGIGTNTNKNVPTQIKITTQNKVQNEETGKEETITTDKKIKQISVGASHTLVLTEDGEIYSWGAGNKGQLGIGNTTNSNLPQKVEIPKSTEFIPRIKDNVVKVIASQNASYAIMQDGKVYAWGEGLGATPKLLTPSYDIVDISKTYALDIEGNVYTRQGRIAIVEKIKYISESDTHAVFLSENGTAYAIGSNTFGQFGDGTNVSSQDSVVAVRNEDVTDVLQDILKIEAGSGYTAALLSDGRVMEWGKNKDGQLGTDEVDETYTTRENTNLSKLTMETAQTILFLDAGANHVVTALSEGNVYSWGLGENGEFGNGMNDSSPEPQKAGKDMVEANTNHLMLYPNDAFDLQASIFYFNLLQDLGGEILYESKDETVVTVDEFSGKVNAISPGTTVIIAKESGTSKIAVVQVRVLPKEVTVEPQVSTNGSHTVALKGNGTVWCYGNNANGELGNGTTNYSDQPVQAIFPEGTIIKQIAAGENFSVALDKEGNVWTWGANDYGQLGNTSTGMTKTPTKIAGLTNITKIAAGTYSVLAIDENKEVYGWGLNANGELGIGSYTNKIISPTKAQNMADVIDIVVGKNHSILLKSTGEAYVTGLNLYGQLGNGDTSIKKVNQFTKVKDLNYVARITATDSGNIVALTDGEVYSWGLNIYGELGLGDKQNRSIPTKAPNIENIVLVSGGKNHSIVLDKTGKIYTAGSGKYGQQGNKSYNENLEYQEVQTFENGMTISAGNTYTVVAKTDGTVWGFGDYNHGDKNFKSKTNSNTPMQVGNDDFGLGITKITIKKSETVNITSQMAYSFNLIYEDKNKTENIRYESINEDIAIVDEHGDVLGVREGTTWVKAIEEDGTEHVVYVYVIDNKTNYAPMVQAGEDFASVLKADGTIWTFGHNNHGELGIGSNKTKDIPEKTNVISSYQDIQAGNSFTIAIRNDRTVWSYGKNNYGQLGIGSTKNGLNPVQVSNLTDIVQIAAGKEHALALDSNGILYGWGRNNEGQLGENDTTILTPVPISYTAGTISSIWAGENQSIFINNKGQVYGYGNMLNGKLEGLENAVKVVVGNSGMLILTTKGEVYRYENGNLNQYADLANIIDISMTNNNILAQTKEERVYTFSYGQTPNLDPIENVMGIGAGVNNSYVILNNGTVYAKGNNQYGQLGNSTRIDSQDFTLVGDRKFKVEPETKMMYVNDIEDVTKEMTLQEFNVFNRSITKPEEYTWTSSDETVATVTKGKITAIGEGTAQISVKDNVTGAEVTIKRIVIPVEKDRIEKITVNDYEATIQEEYKYQVEVETNSDRGTLKITTKNKTDKISIDNGTTWKENGILTQEVELPNDITEIPILVQTANGTQIPYTLVVKKIATDVSLETIEVNGVKATATSSTTYEVVVAENTDVLNILAKANSAKAQVSINGELYTVHQATTSVQYENSIPVTMPIVVQAENGDELEYSLTIYKQSAILQLESLTVAGKEAIKTSEGVYSITVPRNIGKAEVVAKAVSELVNVSIDHANANKQISTKVVAITDEINEVQIRLSTVVDGQEVYKDYTLNIYKKAESGKIQFVIVNGTVVTPKVNGTYEIYLPAETQNATVKVIAQNAEDFVQITTNPKEKAQSEVTVTTPDEVNQYSIEISDSETSEAENYTLYIKKPSVDNTLKQITVSSGDDIVTAKKSTEEENTYIAKVKSYDNCQIKAVTNNINALVGIENEALVKNVATKMITRTSDYMEFTIHTQAESGDQAEYTLKIYVMSNDTELDFIEVNSIKAVLQSDGSYLANLETAETSVTVTAQTVNEKAGVKLETSEFEEHIVTGTVAIDSKDTTTYVTVEAEDGTTVRYKLVIAGLPDDANLQKVVVNGKEAKYIEGQNKYEIRLDDTTFNIEAIASDSLAKVAINGGTESTGKATITMNKEGSATNGVIATVKIDVTAQNGLEKSTYTLEIKERSNDTSIASVQVNGKQATKLADGNYTATIQGNSTQAVIKVEATDSFATVYLDGETQNQNNITVTKQVTQRETIYTIKVKAENGAEEEHTLTVTQLSNNTVIDELSVKWVKEETNKKIDETTGEEVEETTQTEKTQILTLQPDGSYYLKIDRVEEVDVKAILADTNAMVKIENSNYVLAQNEKTIHTVAEITRVTIAVKAEDGSVKEYPLILEKKSNDTSLKSVTSKDMLKFENSKLYVDEDLTQVDITFVTNSDTASIKLAEETNYTPKQITRTIDLSPKPDSEKETDMSDWVANVQVQAEDGTIGEHTIEIIKTGNVGLSSVKADNEEAANTDDTYTARVTTGTKTNVEIQAIKSNAKIEIIKQTQSGEGEEEAITETVIATGTGTLTSDVDLNEDPQEYIIRVTSAGGSSSKDYTLVLQQKSTDTRISYVKVDNLNALQTSDTEYKITVSKKDSYPFVIKLTDEKAFVKISYQDYEGEYVKGKLEGEIPVSDGETLDITMTVKAENGNEQVYHLFVTRISNNVGLEYVKVNGDTITNFNVATKTYTVTVDNTLTQADLQVKAMAENSKITISGTTENGMIQTVTPLGGPGTVQTVLVKVEAEDGTIENYTIKIVQLAASITLEQVTVNNILATKTSQTDYEVTISNKETLAKIIAKTTDSTSQVSIGGGEPTLQTANKELPISSLDDIQTTITVVAEDGVTTQDYTLTIHIQDCDNSVEYVKVNSGTIEPEEDKVTYKTFIDYTSDNAQIEIKLASEKATIEITNKKTEDATEEEGKVTIGSESLGAGVLSFEVETPNDVTTIHYTVTSETGETKEYTIVLTKVSTDASLKELYVKGDLVEVNEDGNYYYEIENPEELLVKAIANNEYANIRIDYNPEEKSQTQANIMAENNTTKVTITITSQSGTTEKYYLYIRVLANNTELDRVVVDSQEVTDYDDKKKTYHAIVDNTKDTYEVFLMAVNNQATVELFDGESLISSGVGSVTELVTLESGESGHAYKVKVSLDDENYSEYTLEITRTSNDTSLKLVEVNDVVRKPLDTDKFIYEVGIPKLAQTAKIKVQATNPYAIVQIGDNEPVRSGTTVQIPLDLSESRITVPVVVTAVDGTTTDTFNIILLRQSNNVTIESVKVNQNELENQDDVYTYYMPEDEFKGTTEVTTVDNATIEVDGQTGVGYLEFDVDFTKDTIKVEKTIKVTSEDGSTTKEYTLVIWKKTYIKGTILTENFEGKHQSTISLYKVEDESTSGEQSLGTLMKQITTEEDGSFEFEISETANYKVVVTKDGYLNYTVTDIKVIPGKTITLDTYKLLAGDIVETGEIELDDLVSINEQYGLTVDYTEGVNDANRKYDFNEDGIVDAKDRNILKKNYGKKAKTVKWVDPDEVAKQQEQVAKAAKKATSSKTKGTSAYEGQFVLPLNSKYTITSNYGDRIGPITETNEKHTGIDIAGEHHAEVLSVTDGEVTWAGVQNGYGNCIEVKHIVNGETIYSFYAHLSEIKVKVGDKVTQGQVIALEGGDPSTDPNPGDSTGHHLHFEIRTKSGYGNDMDPSKYIDF